MGLLTLPFIAVLALVFYPVLTSGGWLWLATWNAVPVILAFAVFFSVFRRSAIAARASGYAFALVILGLTAWGHLSWQLFPPSGRGASTAALGLLFWPFYCIIAALVVSFITWALIRILQRRTI